MLLGGVLFVRLDRVRRDFLLNQKVFKDFVKVFLRQLFEPAIAKAVYHVDAGVIARLVLTGDNVEGYFELHVPSVQNILAQEISAVSVPNVLKLAVFILTVHASVDVAIAALRLEILH